MVPRQGLEMITQPLKNAADMVSISNSNVLPSSFKKHAHWTGGGGLVLQILGLPGQEVSALKPTSSGQIGLKGQDPGCSLGIGDRRILRLLRRILWLNFTCSLKEHP